MQDNPLFSTAADFVNNTSRHIFLTGKAGTGKTTFLKYIKAHTRKKAVVVAPTGVAAINAKGVTIHSLFQLPFGVLMPERMRGEVRGRGFARREVVPPCEPSTAGVDRDVLHGGRPYRTGGRARVGGAPRRLIPGARPGVRGCGPTAGEIVG